MNWPYWLTSHPVLTYCCWDLRFEVAQKIHLRSYPEAIRIPNVLVLEPLSISASWGCIRSGDGPIVPLLVTMLIGALNIIVNVDRKFSWTGCRFPVRYRLRRLVLIQTTGFGAPLLHLIMMMVLFGKSVPKADGKNETEGESYLRRKEMMIRLHRFC